MVGAGVLGGGGGISRFSGGSGDFPHPTSRENPAIYMLSCPSFRLGLVFSINSLTWSGFPLTSFHLAEATLSCFSWLYALVCAVVQKHHKMSFIYNYF